MQLVLAVESGLAYETSSVACVNHQRGYSQYALSL